jgi:hypothetical protein
MTDSLRKMVIFILVGVGAFVLAFGLGQVAGKKKDASGHDHAATSGRYSVKIIGSSSLPVAGTEPQKLRFAVLDPDGKRVTAYDVVHEKKLHLILANRDDPRFYAHLHPAFADGEWSVETDLVGGPYRLYADTTPSGAKPQVLTTDFEVVGDHQVVPPFTPNDTATVDGFDVALKAEGSAYTFAVTKGGEPVELEPYLGAGGHLVGIRTKSLDYLHAHAMAAEGNAVGFHVEASKAGTWVLHLDFQVDGKVHDATFVREIDAAPPAEDMEDMEDMEGHGHDH